MKLPSEVILSKDISLGENSEVDKHRDKFIRYPRILKYVCTYVLITYLIKIVVQIFYAHRCK